MLCLEKLGRLELSEFRIKALLVHVYSFFSEMGLIISIELSAYMNGVKRIS